MIPPLLALLGGQRLEETPVHPAVCATVAHTLSRQPPLRLLELLLEVDEAGFPPPFDPTLLVSSGFRDPTRPSPLAFFDINNGSSWAVAT